MALQLYKDIAHGPEGQKNVVVFVDPSGARREVTDYSGDINTLQQYTGTTGTAGGNVSYQGAQDIFTGYEQEQQRIATNKAAEEAQAISNEQIAQQQGQKFRPRNEGEDMTSYLQQKQAYELSKTGTSTVDLGQQQTFRPRNEGESMTDYLQAKQNFETQQTGKSTVDLGASTKTDPSGYYKVDTGNIGADGKPVYDIYNASTNEKLTYEQGLPLFQQGLNVDLIPAKAGEEKKDTSGYYKELHPGSNYYDVKDADGNVISQEEFQKLGLNIDHIPERNVATGGTDVTTETAAQAGQTKQAGQAEGTQALPVITKPYVQYAGSPDVFTAQGRYVSAQEAGSIPDFSNQIQQISTPRPDLQVEADFAKKAGKDLTSYGSTITPQDFLDNPLLAFENVYQQVYKNLGLPDIQTQIEDLTKQKEELENKRIDEVNAINDNPWLSEAMRSKKVIQLNDKYELKGKAIEESLTLRNALYTRGSQQAQFVAENALNAYHKEREYQQTQLKMAMDRAESLAKLDLSKIKEVNSGLYDLEKNEWIVQPKATEGGLTTAQMQTTINQIVGSFDNEQVVKNYNIVSEGYQFAKDLGTKKTPTSSDDQGLIYAFAKAMDPNSVVREGEYATVQKYAQSWAESYGFKAERIFSNTVFLTEEARQNMIDTIKSKFAVSEKNYQNVSKEYERRIEDVKLGKVGGSITDYSKAFQDNVVQEDFIGPVNVILEGSTKSGIKFKVIK